jgi:hypothetical protein
MDFALSGTVPDNTWYQISCYLRPQTAEPPLISQKVAVHFDRVSLDREVCPRNFAMAILSHFWILDEQFHVAREWALLKKGTRHLTVIYPSFRSESLQADRRFTEQFLASGNTPAFHELSIGWEFGFSRPFRTAILAAL